jgi:NAD(P)H-hydrate epimerase
MLLTRAQARALDDRAIHELGIPSIVLMENAGRGMAELLRRLGIQGPVVVCCGKGNNGGDGFVIARHLGIAGANVRVLLFADPAALTGDAAVNHAILVKASQPVEVMLPLDEARFQAALGGADWVVDALFGTGLAGPVRPPFDRIIEIINASGVRVLAADIPSGLDCDTGRPMGSTVRASHTATVMANKAGFVEPEARAWVGEVHVIDLGVPRVLFSSPASPRPPAAPSSPAGS